MALDILILVIVGAGAVFGFRRGMISQIGQLLALIGGIVAARIFGHHVALFFAGDAAPGMLDYAAGYTVAFLAAYLLVRVIAALLRKVIGAVHLGFIDRLAGAVFKAVLWAFMLSLVLNLYLIIKDNSHELDHPRKPWRAMVIRLAPTTLGFLNQEIPAL